MFNTPAAPSPPTDATTPTSAVAELTSHLLDAERVRSEWVLNRVRLVVLLLLGVASALYAGGKGTGIGLWIAREIVTEHSGTLEAENRAQGGARFTMRFPVARPREERLSA